MKTLLTTLLGSLLVASASAQIGTNAVITQWTFETTIPLLADSTTMTNLPAEVGTGIANGFHASAATDWSNPSGNGSLESLSVNTWAVGDYFQFRTATTGFSDIGVSWAQTGSSTGPRDFGLSYSFDGSTFTPLTNYSLLAVTWSSTIPNSTNTFVVDLSSNPAFNNAADVYFRITNASTVSINGGVVAAAGTGRVDDFTVFQVVAVPEPSQIALFGLGAIGLVAYRLRAARRR